MECRHFLHTSPIAFISLCISPHFAPHYSSFCRLPLLHLYPTHAGFTLSLFPHQVIPIQRAQMKIRMTIPAKEAKKLREKVSQYITIESEAFEPDLNLVSAPVIVFVAFTMSVCVCPGQFVEK